MTPRLDMIGIVSRNLDESMRFYRLLGLDVPDSPAGEDHVECHLPGGLRLAWDSVDLMKQLNPNWVEPVGNRMGLAFLLASPDEVDRKHAQLSGAGYRSRMDPWNAFWGQRYAQIEDPDGNVVDLFCPLESEP